MCVCVCIHACIHACMHVRVCVCVCVTVVGGVVGNNVTRCFQTLFHMSPWSYILINKKKEKKRRSRRKQLSKWTHYSMDNERKRELTVWATNSQLVLWLAIGDTTKCTLNDKCRHFVLLLTLKQENSVGDSLYRKEKQQQEMLSWLTFEMEKNERHLSFYLKLHEKWSGQQNWHVQQQLLPCKVWRIMLKQYLRKHHP